MSRSSHTSFAHIKSFLKITPKNSIRIARSACPRRAVVDLGRTTTRGSTAGASRIPRSARRGVPPHPVARAAAPSRRGAALPPRRGRRAHAHVSSRLAPGRRGASAGRIKEPRAGRVRIPRFAPARRRRRSRPGRGALRSRNTDHRSGCFSSSARLRRLARAPRAPVSSSS
jgi:hypothetical protein